jgi:hypothetical protein
VEVLVGVVDLPVVEAQVSLLADVRVPLVPLLVPLAKLRMRLPGVSGPEQPGLVLPEVLDLVGTGGDELDQDEQQGGCGPGDVSSEAPFGGGGVPSQWAGSIQANREAFGPRSTI